MCHGKNIKLLDKALQLPVILPRRVAAGKLQEILVSGFIEFFQDQARRLRPHQLQLPFVPDPESRIQPDLTVVIADQIQTEAVDGLDMVVVKKGHLTDGRRILRILFKRLRHCLADPLPQLRGSRVRKCDNQNPVQAERIIPVQDPSENALHQDSRLA